MSMTATDVLRRLLDERGVEWDYGITGATTTKFNANGVDLTFTPMRDGLVCSTVLTPAQAIAATLGRGMLTADDVRDLIERHSDASGGNGRDFHNGAYVAIADELNATLGSCNCSDNCTDSERTETCRNAADDGFECSECKSWWIGPRDTKPPMLWGFKYCPNCRRKVVSE